MFRFFSLLFVFCLSIFFAACKKDLPTYLEYESYAFSKEDATGGLWKPILVPNIADITVETPSSTNSAAYQDELKNAKVAIDQMTDVQRKSIAYWTNNPVTRWNEIALELIAKYNLVPGPSDDDSYPAPSAANPAGPPAFPFSHPPYASRALAYLSVAQFDGLIAVWHHKFDFQRLAPYQQDASISYAYVRNTLPAYPSDGAVVASVSRAVLSAMFPLEKAYLEQLEAEHLQSLILSGGNVESDVQAGKAIAAQISALVLARASTDGMKNAQAPKAVADSIKMAAFDRFGWKWENIEVPVRPVGLAPLFGEVKTWCVPNTDDLRPPTPPKFDSPEYLADVELVKDYAAHVTAERAYIANYWQDGIGTYTPPGHWNRFAKEFIVQYKLNPLRAARTFAYLNMAMMDGGICCWNAKYYYSYPRPIQMIPDFKTIAGTPNFPSYPSGHSVFSAAGSEVLAYIFPEEADKVRNWAKEAALSRIYGGIHWSFDAYKGTEQGQSVGQFSVDVARLDGAD